MAKIIIIAGLPKAGKSLLTGGMYEALRQRGFSFFVSRLSPDSEGQWTWESARLDLARELKNDLKKAGVFFSPAFVEFKCAEIRGLSARFEWVVLDMGGIPSPQNKRFLETAMRCGKVYPVLLYKEGQDYSEWEKFFVENGLVPILIKTNWNFQNDIKVQVIELANKILNDIIIGGAEMKEKKTKEVKETKKEKETKAVKIKQGCWDDPADMKTCGCEVCQYNLTLLGE
jgi:hypothetical protein